MLFRSVWAYYNEDDDDLTTLGSIVESRMTVGDQIWNYSFNKAVCTAYNVTVVTADSGTVDCALTTVT